MSVDPGPGFNDLPTRSPIGRRLLFSERLAISLSKKALTGTLTDKELMTLESIATNITLSVGYVALSTSSDEHKKQHIAHKRYVMDFIDAAYKAMADNEPDGELVVDEEGT